MFEQLPRRAKGGRLAIRSEFIDFPSRTHGCAIRYCGCHRNWIKTRSRNRICVRDPEVPRRPWNRRLLDEFHTPSSYYQCCICHQQLPGSTAEPVENVYELPRRGSNRRAGDTVRLQDRIVSEISNYGYELRTTNFLQSHEPFRRPPHQRRPRRETCDSMRGFGLHIWGVGRRC